MKISIIFNASGSILGAAWQGYPQKEKGVKSELAGATAGVGNIPGQAIHEVEIPDELIKLEGEELIQKLREVDTVKQILSKMVTAGQGDYRYLQMIPEDKRSNETTAGQG